MRQGVWAVQLKGIRRQRRGERVVKYHRASGIRLPDLPESHPDFVSAWAMAEAGRTAAARKVSPGSVAEAMQDYRRSADWRGLSAVYQAEQRRHMDAMAKAYGDVTLAVIRAPHIEKDLEPLAPSVANARLKAWRKLMSFRRIEPNPAAQVRRRKVETEGYAPWSAGEIAAFRARWPVGTAARAGFELVHWTGARTCDAVRLSPAQVGTDGVLMFRQSKTGGAAYVPWSNALPAWAAAWEGERQTMRAALGRLAGGFTFLETGGRARSVKGLGNLINGAARDAGLVDRTAHGLRKARLTAIAEAGGSAHAIMAWGGHKSLKEVQHYTLAAQMRRLVTGEEQGGNDVSLFRR